MTALSACKAKDKKDAPACPVSFKELAPGDAATACSCAPDAPTGSVWGTDIYTQDSSICGAARHAGVLADKGGVVEVAPTDGCAGYVGTTRNGVTTSGWGSYPRSFYFTAKSKPACPPSP